MERRGVTIDDHTAPLTTTLTGLGDFVSMIALFYTALVAPYQVSVLVHADAVDSPLNAARFQAFPTGGEVLFDLRKRRGGGRGPLGGEEREEGDTPTMGA